MLVNVIIHFFELVVNLIPFDIPPFPSEVLSIINRFGDMLSNSLSLVKSLLPWSYFVILLRIVLVVEIGLITYKYSIIIFKIVYVVVEKLIAILLEVFTSLQNLVKKLFAVV